MNRFNFSLFNVNSELVTQSILKCNVIPARLVENPFEINLTERMIRASMNYIYFTQIFNYQSQYDIGLQYDFPNGNKIQHKIWKHLSEYTTGWCKTDSNVPGLYLSCLANSLSCISSSCYLFNLFSCEQIKIPKSVLIKDRTRDKVTYISPADSSVSMTYTKFVDTVLPQFQD